MLATESEIRKLWKLKDGDRRVQIRADLAELDEPYIACVVFTDNGIRAHMMSLATFMARYRRRPRPATKAIEFYRTSADEEKYEFDRDVMKLHGEDVEEGILLEPEDAPRPVRLRTKKNAAR